MKIPAVLLAVLLALIPAPALAYTPAPPASPLVVYTHQISATDISLPFDFEPISFEHTGPALPQVDFIDTNFINTIGSIALTMFNFVNIGIVGIMVVLALAMIAIAWLFSFVTDTPSKGASIKHYDIISAGEAADIAYGAANAHINYQEQQAGWLASSEVISRIESGMNADDSWALGDDQMKYVGAGFGQQRDNLRNYRKMYQQGATTWKRLRR